MYERIKLPYKLKDLEPIIYTKTMYYHYEILHKNYEVKLNDAVRGTDLPQKFPSLEKLMANLAKLPTEVREDIRFFGGGLINHNFFFIHLTKPSEKNEERISPDLREIIEKNFTNLENLQKELVKSALQVRGSGWTWLVFNQKKELAIINTANQDGPWSLHLLPLLAIDVWEHAYYLDYGANREAYVKKLVTNLINWKYISQIYLQYTY